MEGQDPHGADQNTGRRADEDRQDARTVKTSAAPIR